MSGQEEKEQTKTEKVESSAVENPDETMTTLSSDESEGESQEVVTESNDLVSEQEEESSESEEEVDVDALIKERDELNLQVEALTGRLRTVSAAFQEKTKEVDETKKRLEKNNELTKSRLRGDVVSNIFTPYENLKRSLEAGRKSGMDEALLSGFQMVHDEFWSALQKLGLEQIPGVGSLFNPNIHEVLTTMPVADAVMNDTVVQVYENGYRINNTVVKTSKVIVGKYYAPPAPPEDEQPTADASTTTEPTEPEITSTDDSLNDDEI